MTLPPDSRQSPAFLAYLRARDAVLRMKGVEITASVESPSAYWAAELDNIDYLLDATPLIVDRIRQHAFHITGIRPYDYRDKGDGRRGHFETRLAALRALDTGEQLLVPESRELGGFGYEIGGRLFNVDTLKFYEVLVGMQRSGVLTALARRSRPIVCEIGAGWGGFAYQFKRLVPAATYVIVDFPELFLFSATYLGALYPDARIVFWTGDDALTHEACGDADFVFVPHTCADRISTLPLDLLVNMVSFQEMTADQVRAYVDIAAAAQCPWLYSLNRERSPYNAELTSVSAILREHYQLDRVDVLETDYTSAMRKPAKAGRVPAADARTLNELGYRHLAGRLAVPVGGAKGLAAPRVALGMTLYNNATYLREALDSLLAQTFTNFGLLLVDDASTDESESIGRQYAARDPRVRYVRHETRRAMVATWRDAAELALREWPGAEYFAWASDHDRWDPQWLARLVETLDADADAVLAYPIARRMAADGTESGKGPRRFETTRGASLAMRWREFCRHGVGAGDMVYGLVRASFPPRVGYFRRVLRPDRLFVAEMVLHGGIRQVPAVLWFRRQFDTTSIARQARTLVLSEEQPPGFGDAPWRQHARVIRRAYAPGDRLGVGHLRLTSMLLSYQRHYAWRHIRRSETTHAVGRAVHRVTRAKKWMTHHYHHAIFHALVGGRAAWTRARAGVRPGRGDDGTGAS